ncbi:hypothetical protein EW146_g6984 [Bondarzewia mesenterica]|uniref:Uncharacterized protein n=1 Tax=Bondarzewia mesenterica TaxID=1095465 RepID=A0A4S4LNW4_9AGAM|nr:hypothetical protein EW146_g6984 [Bondarzewia mesenterica]
MSETTRTSTAWHRLWYHQARKATVHPRNDAPDASFDASGASPSHGTNSADIPSAAPSDRGRQSLPDYKAIDSRIP